MSDHLEEIGSISDVSYLLTLLRLAKRRNESSTIRAVLERLRESGLLREQESDEGSPYDNLRE